MRQYVHSGLRGLHVCFPAKIVDVLQDQTVDVQPSFLARYVGKDPSPLPIVRGVPVVMPMGILWRVSFPLAVGDTGLCIVADRNLDTWLAGDGGMADPLDTRAHALADAVFLPGLVPTKGQTDDTSGDLVLGNGAGAAEIRIGDGTIALKNDAGEALSLIAGALSALASSVASLGRPAASAVTAASKLKSFAP